MVTARYDNNYNEFLHGRQSFRTLCYSHAYFSLFLQTVEIISCGNQQHAIDAVDRSELVNRKKSTAVLKLILIVNSFIMTAFILQEMATDRRMNGGKPLYI